jgi:hypothetical protein
LSIELSRPNSEASMRRIDIRNESATTGGGRKEIGNDRSDGIV